MTFCPRFKKKRTFRVVTKNEAWVHFYDPNQLSMEWEHPSSQRPQIFIALFFF